jgi:hypothetical protein
MLESDLIIDYGEAKRQLPCTLLQLMQNDASLRLKRESAHKWKGLCPFHKDEKPSLSVYYSKDHSDWRYHCFGCGRDGDILDYVKETQGLGPRAALDWLSGGHARDFFQRRPSDHELAGVILDPSRIQKIHSLTVAAMANQLRDREMRGRRPWYDAPYNYGRMRGWVPDHLAGADPYPVGACQVPGDSHRSALLSEFAVLAFPKLVRTRRTAVLFGVQPEFDDFGGSVCVGIKFRLTPEAREHLIDDSMQTGAPRDAADAEAPRWLAKPGYSVSIPWEFDSNDSAPVLVIAEGPGDGVRLYHEAYATEEAAQRFGLKAHLVATDATGAWTEASLPRADSGVGFFDGYKHIVLLLDPDKGGRQAADTILTLARKQGADATIRDVKFPDGDDLSAWFDRGRNIFDLISLINNTIPTPPPESQPDIPGGRPN